MMKLILLSVLFAFVLQTNAQDKIAVDPRIVSAFGYTKINTWETDSPDSILYFNFVCSSGYKFLKSEQLSDIEKSMAADTVDLLRQLDFVISDSPLEFNILLLDRKYWSYGNSKKIYRVAYSDYYLRIPDIGYISRKFQGYKDFFGSSK